MHIIIISIVGGCHCSGSSEALIVVSVTQFIEDCVLYVLYCVLC